jgi:hypothetical protein
MTAVDKLPLRPAPRFRAVEMPLNARVKRANKKRAPSGVRQFGNPNEFSAAQPAGESHAVA